MAAPFDRAMREVLLELDAHNVSRDLRDKVDKALESARVRAPA